MFIRSMKFFIVFSTYCLLSTQPLFADLGYTLRGDRYEGRKDLTVSGGGLIELVSAVISSTSNDSISEFCQLKFYIPQNYTVDDIVVRELELRKYYWLDRVQKKWRSGDTNDYEWSAKDVLKPLGIEDISKLGVVVRLRNQSGEYVTPAIFYSGDSPSLTDEYRFTFRPLTGITNLSYAVYDEQSKSDVALLSGDFEKVSFNKSFVILLESGNFQREGFYELLIDGVTLYNSSVNEKIIFYHHKP